MKSISVKAAAWCLVPLAAVAITLSVRAHDIISTAVTWNREISVIFKARCISCHNDNGTAFSLATFKDAYPWKTAIREEVLQRRMPPWGAVKGFGDFRNDQSLTPEQFELIFSWAEGGAPEGDLPSLPPPPTMPDETKPDAKKETGWAEEASDYKHPPGEILVSGELTLTREFALDGIWPKTVPEGGSFQLTAQLPNGRTEPLVWLMNYKTEFGHPFLFRKPIVLPRRTIIRGLPSGASVYFLPVIPPVSEGASLTKKPVQK